MPASALDPRVDGPCRPGLWALDLGPADPAAQTIHADGLGSIIAMTDAAGNVTSRRQYDAWGNLEVGADQPGYAFTGREWDPETQLYYYRARYYDPKIGRFISQDPIGFAGGVNLYPYVGNRPTTLSDPLGLDPPGDVIWNLYLQWSKEQGQGRSFDEWYNDPKTTDEERTLVDTLDPNPAVDPVLMVAGAAAGLLTMSAGSGCSPTTAIGKLKDLKTLKGRYRTLLKHLPDLGNPKANWYQNAKALRIEMAKGLPIRDVSVDAAGRLIEYPGSFLNAERNLLMNHGWAYNPLTRLWSPPL
jgi:RHS repeat-associated protein